MQFKYDHMVTFFWVKNWDKAIDFYSNILGLTKSYESEGWAEFNLPGLKDAYLAINHQTQKEIEVKQNNFLTLRVDNLDAFFQHLKEHHVPITKDTEDFIEEGQGIRLFKFSDPDGNILTAAEII